MELTRALVKDFAKVINSASEKSKTSSVNLNGTAKIDENGKKYVQIDGSDQFTPISELTDIQNGDRVLVTIENHKAIVIGNYSYPPSARKANEALETVKTLKLDSITVDNLAAQMASIGYLTVDEANIAYAKLTELDANAITAETLDVAVAKAGYLKADKAEITYVKANELEADLAKLGYLQANEIMTNVANIGYLKAKDADLKYANVDFSNIGQAAIEKFFSDSGIIEDLVISNGQVTGQLVGVTIKGDLIEGGTVVAEKLVILGEDGLYYKLNTNGVTTSAEQTDYNSLNGRVITAKSITAEKVSVDDLVAFDATIAGLNLTNGSIYSGVKTTVHNSTRGFYLDKNGQLSLGDTNSYLKYYKDQNGVYRLEISADNIVFRNGGSVEDAINNISVGGRNLIRNSSNLIFDNYGFGEASSFTGDYLADENGNILLDENGDMLVE